MNFVAGMYLLCYKASLRTAVTEGRREFTNAFLFSQKEAIFYSILLFSFIHLVPFSIFFWSGEKNQAGWVVGLLFFLQNKKQKDKTRVT